MRRDDLIALLRGDERAITGLEVLDDAVFAAVPELRIVSKYGVGLDMIDLAAARRHGVSIRWTPGVNRQAVAELAIGLMIALCRRMVPLAHAITAGGWTHPGGRQLSSSVVGVIGCGHVGQVVARLCRAFGAAVIANDLDVRVCWVDLSWPAQRSQRSRQAPELQGHDGIYEILTGRVELEEALQVTDDPRLVILRAGRVPHPERPELARSPLLATLLDELEKQFEYLVFDMPPILAGSAGLGLVRHTDSYLLVVRHGVTTTQQVRAAVEELRVVPSVGVVLNRYSSHVPNWLAHFFAP
jgi:hypothetical protein